MEKVEEYGGEEVEEEETEYYSDANEEVQEEFIQQVKVSKYGSFRPANPHVVYMKIAKNDALPEARVSKVQLQNDIPPGAMKYNPPPRINTRDLAPVKSQEVAQQIYDDSKLLKVYIVSHRRSGTHLTGMALANNFRNIDIEYVLNHPPCDDLRVGCELFNHMRTNGKIVHVARDPRDTMVSFYHFIKRVSRKHNFMTFSEFLQEKKYEHTVRGYRFGEFLNLQRASYLMYHMESWYTQMEDVLHVQFDDWLTNLEPTLQLMSAFLERPYYLTTHENWSTNITRPVSFRKGITGDWINEFSKEDMDFIDHIWNTKPNFPIPFLNCTDSKTT